MSSMSATMRSTMMWVFLLFDLVEQFGQGFLGPVALLLGIDFLLGFDDVLGQFEDLPSGTPGWSRSPCSWRSLIFSSRSPSAVNFGLPTCLRSRAMSLISISLRLLAGFGVLEDVLQHLGVQDQRLEVVAHRLDVDVLVDQFDGLGARACQSSLPLPLGGFTDS